MTVDELAAILRQRLQQGDPSWMGNTRQVCEDYGVTLVEAVEAMGIAMPPQPQPDTTFKQRVQQEAHQIRIRNAARELVAAEEHAKSWKPPADFGTLKDELAQADQAPQWRVKGLLGLGHNAIPVARRKAGKTTLIGNLVRSVVDGEPFLGRFDVTPIEGSVAIFNYEVDELQYRRWLRETRIVHADRVHVLHLRGKALPLSDVRIRKWVINWLKERDVTMWLPDPYSRAYVGCVENGNDEAQVGRFLDILDVIKAEAGVSELVMPTHTPKAKTESGDETAIGSQRLEAWPDSMWYLTKDQKSGLRFLRAEGRDIDVAEEQLTYNEATRSLILGGWDRNTTVKRLDADLVVSYVTENPGCTQNAIQDNFPGWDARKTKAAVHAAGRRINVQLGRNRAKLHYPVSF